MKIARVMASLALLALLAGCSDSQDVVEPAPVPDEHVGAAAADDPYARIVASIEARGAAGAQSAWDGGKPALLLFAAGW